MGTIQAQQPLSQSCLHKYATPLPFNGRGRGKVEGETLFQTSAVQRQRWEKPTTSASFGQRLRSNQVKNRRHVKDTITITKGVSGR